MSTTGSATVPSRAAVARGLARATYLSFGLFAVLSLSIPSWRVGPFTWWPVLRLQEFAGEPAQIGILSLLPGLFLLCWIGWRWLEQPRRPWLWGRPAVVLPLAGLAVLTAVSLGPALFTPAAVRPVVSLAVVGVFYLFYVNERPRLTPIFAPVVLIQGSVAVAQFLLQRDLGLTALGERTLGPTVPKTSLIEVGSTYWVRGYGLAAHPNVLATLLAVGLLIVLVELHQARQAAISPGPRWQRVVVAPALAAGLAGLLVSFSRAGWLAFAAGLAVWTLAAAKTWSAAERRQASAGLAVGLAIAAAFVVRYRDLVATRLWRLSTPLEAKSINERLRDAQLALELIKAHPWLGVGPGNYVPTVRALEPEAIAVHNIPLLLAAELGLPALGLLVWLWAAPFVRLERGAGGRGLAVRLVLLPAAAPWVAMIVESLFDVAMWWGASWKTAMLVGLLAALQSVAEPPSAHRRPTR
ncbi:MAG: O-antigen ligase family protein [Caldilineales bacterium]|nr:O-antigen ligase family protein [Caldilineales bacterium]